MCAEEAGSKTKTSRLFVFSSEAMARRADTTALTVSLQEEHLPVVMVTSRLVLPIAMTWTEKSACIANLPRSHKHTCVLPAVAIVLLYCGWLCCYTTTTYCCLRSLALVTCHPRAARIVTKKRKNGGKKRKEQDGKRVLWMQKRKKTYSTYSYFSSSWKNEATKTRKNGKKKQQKRSKKKQRKQRTSGGFPNKYFPRRQLRTEKG